MVVYRIGVGIDFRIPHRYRAGAPALERRAREQQQRVMADVAALSEIFVTDVMYATRAEFVQEAAQSCARSFPTKTVRGTVAGVGFGFYGVLALGESGVIFDGSESSNSVIFNGVQSGLVDFFGTRTKPGNAPDRAVAQSVRFQP